LLNANTFCTWTHTEAQTQTGGGGKTGHEYRYLSKEGGGQATVIAAEQVVVIDHMLAIGVELVPSVMCPAGLLITCMATVSCCCWEGSPCSAARAFMMSGTSEKNSDSTYQESTHMSY
jgi:hypothetical protein